MTLIPPYDHADVIAGQGTAAKQLFDEIGPLDAEAAANLIRLTRCNINACDDTSITHAEHPRSSIFTSML